MAERFGKTKYATIRRDFNKLRNAVNEHDALATEAAWEKCERWLEAIPTSDTIAALQAENAKLQKEKQELCLQVMASDMQAQEAYEAQLKAEVESAKLREAADALADAVIPVGYIHNDVITDSVKRRDEAYGDEGLMRMRQLYLDARKAEKLQLDTALSAYRNVKGENDAG